MLVNRWCSEENLCQLQSFSYRHNNSPIKLQCLNDLGDTITYNVRSQTVLECHLHHCYHIAQEHATFSVPLHLINFLKGTATPLQTVASSASQIMQHCPWLYLAAAPPLIVSNWWIPLSTFTEPITLQCLHCTLQVSSFLLTQLGRASTVQVIHASNNDQIWNY